MTNGLVADPIHLRCESEGHESHGMHFGFAAEQRIDAAIDNPALHLRLDTKQVIMRAWCADVLGWTQQNIEAQDETVGNGSIEGGVSGVGKVCNSGNHIERKRLDACGRGILAFPRTQKGSMTEVQLAEGVQARVRGPQCDICLPLTS